MTEVLVTGLTKHYDGKIALKELNLTIESRQFITLLGPSGCGKTTTLRCLAGLERPSAGTITIGDDIMVETSRGIFVPPERRHVGMVFQSYALWPHMTVAENVVYPLKVARIRKPEREQRVREVLEAVGLGAFEERPVTALSGGQQQRVALARALAARPGVIFYDEPLSNLDAKLRYQMGQQVRSLHNQFASTSVYVTHDQEEAITLSDRIIVMNNGMVVQDGTPSELYDRPASAYVADFMGFQNILSATVLSVDTDHAQVRVDGTPIVLAGTVAGKVSPGDQVDLAFRGAHVRLERDHTAGPGRFSAEVERTTYLGSAINILLRAHGVSLRMRIDTSDLDRLTSAPVKGETLALAVSPARAMVLPRNDASHEYMTSRTDALVAPR